MIFLLPCERSSLSVATTAYDVELEPVLLTGEKPSSQPPQFHSQLIGFRFESSGTNVPKIPEALDSIRWKWQPRSSWDSDANTIAQQLIDESERYFPLVQFEDWVQEARDRSSPIVKALESKQNIDSDAALHFLLPFVKLQSQESTATLQIVSAAQKYALRNTSNKASQRLLSFLIPLCFCV
ncbi:hypothetical protein CBS115989_10127 [Aspergillus niger]|nr:hypothetical protein CBS115989_10127 [Aspergillus niger]